MATPFLILDGYNLMHAAGLAQRSYPAGMLAQCRKRLNRLVVSLLTAEALSRATIVYDAFDSPSNERRESIVEGLRVLFAPKGTDADGEIERLLKTHSAPRQVVVVSGDHRLHKAARRRKAVCIDSEEFLASLNADSTGDRSGVARSSPARSGPPDEPIPHLPDMERWVRDQQEHSADTYFDADYLNEIEDEFG